MTKPISRNHAPLAILPGLLCDSRMFGSQLRAFPEAVVVDGFYAGCTSLEAMADYALERLPRTFSLLGHSMGARVALEILRRAPERIERLALADTGIHPTAIGERERRYALRDVGRRHGIASLVAEWLPPMLAPQNAALARVLSEMCIDAGQEGFERQIEALLARPAVEDLLASISCPVLVIVGELDAWSPPAQHFEIASAVPGAVLRVVPRSGHMLPFESPETFNMAIAEWLRQPTSCLSNS